MGVKGLTSFAYEAVRSVSEQVDLPVLQDSSSSSSSTQSSDRGPFVIDGWAWIYRTYFDHFPDSIYGGDYRSFSRNIVACIDALRATCLDPIFVFDGPCLPIKLPTVLNRASSVAAANSPFMRSTSKMNPRFQVEMGIVAPLLYDCVLTTLRNHNVQVVISETEADSAIAELAEELGGWAVSNDSDFFILCSRGTNCKGYVPVHSIQYLVQPPQIQDTPTKEQAEPLNEDGFEQVGKKHKSRTKATKAVSTTAQPKLALHTLLDLPPTTQDQGTLVSVRFASFSSIKLAQLLDFPPSLLPLFASLVGNDYTTPFQSRIFDLALSKGWERINQVAAILKQECQKVSTSSSTGSRTPSAAAVRSGTSTPMLRNGVARSAVPTSMHNSFTAGSTVPSVSATPTLGGSHPKMDLALSSISDPLCETVESIINRILERLGSSPEKYITGEEKDELIDSIIDSVCTYSLQTLSSAPHHKSPGAQFFKPSFTALRSQAQQDALDRYRSNYQASLLDKGLVEALTQRFYLCRQFVEDPDYQSVQITHARDLRRFLWTTLFEVWGMGWARETMEEPLPPDPSTCIEETQCDTASCHSEDEEDPDQLIPVETPPSSIDGYSTVDESDNEDDDDQDNNADMDNLLSRPGSVYGSVSDREEQQQEPTIRPPPAVLEYARKGDRLVGTFVEILPLATLVEVQLEFTHLEAAPEILTTFLRNRSQPQDMPLAVAPLDVRMSTYLVAHGVSDSFPDSVPKSYWPLIATLRFLIQKEASRLGESFKRYNWSRSEVLAAILSGLRASTTTSPHISIPSNRIEPCVKSIHLMSMLQLTLYSSWLLAQSLFLVTRSEFYLPPYALVWGDEFHRLALLPVSELLKDVTELELQVIDLVLDSKIEPLLSIDIIALRKEKKIKKKLEKAIITPSKNKPLHRSVLQSSGFSGFSLLDQENV